MKSLRLLAIGALVFSFSTYAFAQEEPTDEEDEIEVQNTAASYYKYRITLTDKNNSGFSIARPQDFLSEKSIQRRKKQGIKIDSLDLPVTKAYVDGIAAKGVEILLASKWNNTVLVGCEDTTLIQDISQLPYVKATRKVATYGQKEMHFKDNLRYDKIKKYNEEEYDFGSQYGNALSQIKQLNGIALHEKSFTGKGITIAVIDAGFYNADIIPALKNTKILGTRDFVADSEDIYSEGSHGMMVLSCMGTNQSYMQVGTAPDAEYWLLRSEDERSEQLVEEDYWASAIEFADSVGVDVVNTSLGYTKFDNPADNVLYREQDGITQLISFSASQVASRGMILCCSAGNSGDEQWKRIGCPGDAKDILTVGAVGADGKNTNFSSLGYSADGRVKPDVVAQGGFSGVLGVDGLPTFANGTSFSSPILCGLVASLWSAYPEKTSYEIMDMVRKSANNYEFPDNVYGYGLPDFAKALDLGK